MEEYYEIIYHNKNNGQEHIYLSPNKNGELKVSEDQRCGGSKLEQDDLEEVYRTLKKIFKSRERTQRD